LGPLEIAVSGLRPATSSTLGLAACLHDMKTEGSFMNLKSAGPALICAFAGLTLVTVGCATKKYAFQSFAPVHNQMAGVSKQTKEDSTAVTATAVPVESKSINKAKQKPAERSWDDSKSFLPPNLKSNWTARHQIPLEYVPDEAC